MYRILVVDDEPQVRDLTARALKSCDLTCDSAVDGDEALDMFEAQPYDAVVTDLRMPRRHGHALAVELLRRPEPPKVLVVTGLAEPRLVRDLMGRGVEDILYKPIDYNVLAMKLLTLSEKNRRAAPPTVEIEEVLEGPTSLLTKIEKSLVELTDIFEDALAGVFDIEEDLHEPPEAVSDFITRFAQNEDEDATHSPELEMRIKERVRCHGAVVAVPVTRLFAPCGEPFCAAIRDVSESGIRLLHTRAVNSDFLALEWRGEAVPAATIRVAAKVMRCQPLSPFYDIGGQFVMAD